MHQPSGQMQGQAADIAIQAEQIIYLKRMMAERIAFHTGQPVERIEADSDRDRWFTAEEALEYGFIDKVIDRSTLQLGHCLSRVAAPTGRSSLGQSGWRRDAVVGGVCRHIGHGGAYARRNRERIVEEPSGEGDLLRPAAALEDPPPSRGRLPAMNATAGEFWTEQVLIGAVSLVRKRNAPVEPSSAVEARRGADEDVVVTRASEVDEHRGGEVVAPSSVWDQSRVPAAVQA